MRLGLDGYERQSVPSVILKTYVTQLRYPKNPKKSASKSDLTLQNVEVIVYYNVSNLF